MKNEIDEFEFLISSPRRNRIILFSLFACLTPPLRAASIDVFPAVFDFGWVPDNAIVATDFTVRNLSAATISLTAVQPSCGCTATDFTPEGLPSAETKKINITFNTHGYTGLKFDKSVNVRAGIPEENVVVRIKGHVLDPDAKVVPEGDGIVALSESSGTKRSVDIVNKSTDAVVLAMVQAPASWVNVKMPETKINPGQKVPIEVKAAGSLSGTQQTSFTLEAKNEMNAVRLTIAVRTGTEPEPYRKLRNAPRIEKAPPAPASSSGPAKP